MNYNETLDYIYAKLPMFSRVGAAAYKADLNNINALCNSLGNPQHKFKSIHIAGTNGKGSCSHMLAAVMQQAGYKCGLYTSPHIADFRERIRIQGEMISKEFVVEFIASIEQLIEEIQPSFFEITVALAFDYFAKQEIEIAIIEVGLGGLLDSTNIIQPELSIITNISFDHMNLLGNTLPEIAVQKAGIIKPHAPIVIGETQIETRNIFFAKSIQEMSQIFFADESFVKINEVIDHQQLHISYLQFPINKRIDISTDLLGAYQAKNIATVLTAGYILQQLGWRTNIDIIKIALRQVKKTTHIKGRFDIVKRDPYVIFDVSHNEAGVAELILQMQTLEVSNIHCIMGFVKDKSIEKILSLFPKNYLIYATQAEIERALPSDELTEICKKQNLKTVAYKNTKSALDAASKNLKADEAILVCGSFFLMQDAYAWLSDEQSIK